MHATQRESPPSFATRSSLAEHNGAINYATLWAQLKPLLYASAITSRKREKWSCIGREFGKNGGPDRADSPRPSVRWGGGGGLLQRGGRCQRRHAFPRNELCALLLYSLVEVVQQLCSLFLSIYWRSCRCRSCAKVLLVFVVDVVRGKCTHRFY